METQKDWEQAFNTLDKRVFSVDAIGGYDFKKHLEQHTTKESRVLDFGCGRGDLVKSFRSEGYKAIYGTDPSEGLLKQGSMDDEILKVMKNGLIPFPDDSFDFVYCSGVLHHIEWALFPSVLSEVSRVLKPKGIFLYSEPRDSFLRKLGHMVVLSPLSRLSRNAWALAGCLRAEWPTYHPWLKREKGEFVPLCKKNGFVHQVTENKLFTTIGVLRNEK